MSRIQTDTLRQIGVVVRPHGVRGELILRPETDNPDRVLGIKRVFVGSAVDKVSEYAVTSVRTHIAGGHQSLLIGLESIGDRDLAASLSGAEVYAEESALPPLEEDELYLDSLIGMQAVTPDSVLLGEILDVLEAPGQHLLRIRTVAGGEALVPLVPALVPSIDTEHRTVTIEPLEGLIEAAD